MPTSADIAQQIKSALALSEPDLDTSIGSVAGKIIDAVTLPMAEAFLDQQLTQYQYDIDSMTAGTLDGFVRLFGMARKNARYAVGIVTFGRAASTAAKGVANIPVGTQVMSNTSPVVYVQTTGSAIMSVGQTTVDVPVQAIVAGSAGNVAAGTLTSLSSNVGGVSTNTTNTLAMAFGQDQEDDDTLRERWKTTVFRNLAGTTQMYAAMALQADDAVGAVNVLGSKKTWTDRITITGGTSPAMSFGNPAFIYSSGVFVGPDLGSANLLSQGTDFTATINNTVAPATVTITSVSGGSLSDGIYDIQFDYVPTYSRNNPYGTRFNETAYVNNRIDIWATGQDPVSVVQAGKFSSAATTKFTNTATDNLYLGKYKTLNGAYPSAGDVFMPLAYCPILSVPNNIILSGSSYTEGVHYDIIHRSDAFGYGPSSSAGLVWYAAPVGITDPSFPPTGSTFSLSYIYNQVPAQIQSQIEGAWRLLGTDFQAHAGIEQLYRFHLGVVYDRGVDTGTVNTAITAAISTLLAGLGFDSSMQVSDVIQVVHNVVGVDNVRFMNSTDTDTQSAAGHYAIEAMNTNGSVSSLIASSGRAVDVYFDDATYPELYDVQIVTLTRTNFGVA